MRLQKQNSKTHQIHRRPGKSTTAARTHSRRDMNKCQDKEDILKSTFRVRKRKKEPLALKVKAEHQYLWRYLANFPQLKNILLN